MVIDGKQIAQEIYNEVAKQVRELPSRPRMTAVTCAPNFETQKYLNLKKRKAAEVGIALNIVELDQSSTTEQVIDCITKVAEQADGVVVQLPFPAQVNREQILTAVPVERDPDAFNGDQSVCISPVAGAIQEIAIRYHLDWNKKNVVVLGYGSLVGKPAAAFAKAAGANVTVVPEELEDMSELLQQADVIISGIGNPGYITSEKVKDGVVIFDAGTSEDGGELRGDVDPAVAEKAALFTPVPGGIGPITVAILLRNLVALVSRK